MCAAERSSPRAVEPVWSEFAWRVRERAIRRCALAAAGEVEARALLTRACRVLMRTYTTGFFIASRFLPVAKRNDVELIYAAVRYPDEVVDTFPLPAAERATRLDAWAEAYERALRAVSLQAMLADGVPAFLAGFADVVRRFGIPPQHYRDFLAAMRRDIEPRPFDTLDDLIASYVHGSAIVVGWFLTYAYGPSAPSQLPRALAAARDLGIALQLTNFLRDVAEDFRRGRLYLPLEALRTAGIERPDPTDPSQHAGFDRVVCDLAGEAGRLYDRSAAALDAFAADCRLAIRACIAVYGQLNARIRAEGFKPGRRASVPPREKWRMLPVRKWWVIPAAYARAAHERRWLDRLARKIEGEGSS